MAGKGDFECFFQYILKQQNTKILAKQVQDVTR